MNKGKEIEYYSSNREEMLELVPITAKTLLDVGCGAGAFCSVAKRHGLDVYGVEMEADMAARAGNVCTKVWVGSFENSFDKLPKAKFDVISFNDVLEHMVDPWTVLTKAKELLTSDGVIICSIPNIRYIGVFITEIIFKKDFIYRPEGGILDNTHLRFFTLKSMRRMFEELGFDIVKYMGTKPCKSWKEKLFIALSFGFFSDCRYKRYCFQLSPR